jgi:hypothetical protein
MLGAIAGDIIGSVYEANPVKTTDFQLFSEFSRFTDDTVLTIATAHALMQGMGYAEAYRQFGRRYPGAGYGGSFISWLRIDEAPPYRSWRNGLPMPITGKFRKPLEKNDGAKRHPQIFNLQSSIFNPGLPGLGIAFE